MFLINSNKHVAHAYRQGHLMVFVFLSLSAICMLYACVSARVDISISLLVRIFTSPTVTSGHSMSTADNN